MHPLLVADIGGTNARFAIALGEKLGAIQLLEQRDYPCAEFSCFDAVLRQYVGSLREKNLKRAAIAIAGPAADNFAKMTNLDWEISAHGVQQQFGFDSVMFVNDLAAHALATAYLEPSQFANIKPGTAQAKATRAIIGPGTGLGVASLHWHRDGWRAFPTEGGHVAFGPSTAIETEIYHLLFKQHGYVSLEMLLSGPGLINIYQSLSTINNQARKFSSARDILHYSDSDDLCMESVNVFIGALGGAAGDLALVYGAKGGLYLGGGMTKHLLPFIPKPGFMQRFLQKGFRSEYLASIPIDAILYPNPGLLGAALWYYQHSPAHEPIFL
jgi:glucokinase